MTKAHCITIARKGSGLCRLAHFDWGISKDISIRTKGAHSSGKLSFGTVKTLDYGRYGYIQQTSEYCDLILGRHVNSHM
jgi:hypothetical protein